MYAVGIGALYGSSYSSSLCASGFKKDPANPRANANPVPFNATLMKPPRKSRASGAVNPINPLVIKANLRATNTLAINPALPVPSRIKGILSNNLPRTVLSRSFLRVVRTRGLPSKRPILARARARARGYATMDRKE